MRRTRTMRESTMLSAFSAVLHLTMLSTLMSGASAQVGVTICACQPAVWDIQLDFAKSCADETWEAGPGIQETFCNIASTDPSVTDLQITEIDRIQFIEADQNLDAVNTLPFNRSFVDGETLLIPSIIGNPSNSFTETTLPKLAQLDIFGTNAAGQSLLATWSLLFTNDCATFPVVEAGEESVLTIVRDVDPPPVELCPLAGLTSSPSHQPSEEPSDKPSEGGPVIGVDLCGCQPGEWNFTIDFNLTCADQTFAAGQPGIEDVECLETPPAIGEATFASIEGANIIEADQDGTAINQIPFGALNDGDQITYVSVLNLFPSFNSTTLPKSILVVFQGLNAAGASLTVLWTLAFTNDCDDFPVVEPGAKSATTLVSGVADPPAPLCPVVGFQPSAVPSSSPSDSPSRSPSSVPSYVPTSIPSPLPSKLPTSTPSSKPSLMPSNSPSDEPSTLPSSEPSLMPSNSPSDVPSILPSSEPSLMPSNSPSDEPSILPSSIPSLMPSNSLSNEPSSFPSIEPSALSDSPSSEPTIIAPTCPPVATKQPKSSKSAKSSSPAFQGSGSRSPSSKGKGKGGKGKGGKGEGKRMEVSKPKMERMRMKPMSLMMNKSEVYYTMKSNGSSSNSMAMKPSRSKTPPPSDSPSTAAPSLSPTFAPSAAPTCAPEKSSKSPGKGGSMMSMSEGKSSSSMSKSSGKGGSMMSMSEGELSTSMSKSPGKGGSMTSMSEGESRSSMSKSPGKGGSMMSMSEQRVLRSMWLRI